MVANRFEKPISKLFSGISAKVTLATLETEFKRKVLAREIDIEVMTRGPNSKKKYVTQKAEISETEGKEIIDLLPKNQLRYEKDHSDFKVKSNLIFLSLVDCLAIGSAPYSISRKYAPTGDWKGLLRELRTTYNQKTCSGMLNFACRYLDMTTGDNSVEWSKIIEEKAEFDSELYRTLGVSDSEAEQQKVDAALLKYVELIVIQRRTSKTESIKIGDYIQRKIREKESLDPLCFDFGEFYTSLSTYMNCTNHGKSNIVVKSKKRRGDLSDDSDNESAVHLNSLRYVNVAGKKMKVTKRNRSIIRTALTGVQHDRRSSGKSNNESRKTDKAKRVCGYCKKVGHTSDWCYHNPDRSPDAPKQRPKVDSMELDDLDDETVVNIDMMNTDLADSGFHTGDDQSDIAGIKTFVNLLPILSDGGSTHNVLNINHSHLFVSYRTIEPRPIEGIGGTTNIQVVGKGTINFLNTTIDALYAPGIKQSVLSEGRLTNRYGFTIRKVGRVVTFTSPTGESLDLTLSSDSRPNIPILHNFRYNEIKSCNPTKIALASVRPCDARTLWHARFGHFNMRSILAMARNPLYRERGLIVPENLLKHDGEPDLCQSCAQGKPTISRSHQ
jgi:hypothetical protein